MQQKNSNSIFNFNGTNFILPFCLITTCFALWGFANDITNPMVKAFSKIFKMSVADGTLVQVAFYGGYFAMAFPAALFIKKYSYKTGILMGLALYAIGALLFFPAKLIGDYYPFLIAYFIMTCGLSFLETSANPFILAMGSRKTATRRLNLAQAFNPIGSLCGMYIAMNFIQAKLNPLSGEERSLLAPDAFNAIKEADLGVLITPYLYIALVIAAIMIAIKMIRIPAIKEEEETPEQDSSMISSMKRLLHNKHYYCGVIAQFFYVGVQIMCWTFIIQYGTHYFMLDGMSEKAAEMRAQEFNIYAMIFFVCSRFICTFLLKYFNPGMLLMILAGVGALLICGVIGLQNGSGIYCLVGVSACMSLMFPTIYGIALEHVKQDAKLGAAGLIMSILGGSVLPPIQAAIIDHKADILTLPAVNVSFVLPLICFIVIAVYGYGTITRRI